MTTTSRYKEAGVDIDKGNAFVRRISDIVAATHSRAVLTELGGFSGGFAIGNFDCQDPVLMAATDGVGTKLNVAMRCHRHDTIGIDLVAMCVNDIIVSGARPLFFLDYLAVNQLDLEQASQIVEGIATGCRQANCSLIGGETAEMPSLYQQGEYDLAGFAVGICDRAKIIDGSDIRVGDRIIGLASSGLHSNGYSLVRQIFFEELGHGVDDHIDELGCTVGEELLRPTRIYVNSVLKLIRQFPVHGLIHNTGGGFYDNIPRILPQSCRAIIQADAWQIPPVFSFLEKQGHIDRKEMYRIFNMGIGMMLLIPADQTEDILLQLQALGEKASVIGEVLPITAGAPKVELLT